MPRIDLGQGTDLVQGLVHGPDINVAGAGKAFNEEANFGGELSKIAGDAAAARKQADDSNFAFTTTLDDQKAIEAQSVKLQLAAPPGAKGYTDQMQSFIQDRIDSNTSQAPSSEAADQYSKSISRYAADRVIEAGRYERTETAAKYRQDITDATTQAASRFMDNPNYLTFGDTSDIITKQIQDGAGVNFQAGEVPDLVQKAKQQLAVGVLEGLGTQERYGEALKLLKSGQNIGDSLSDDMKKHYEEKFNGYVEAKQASSVGEYGKQVEDMKTAALMGRPLATGDVAGLINQMSANPKVTDDQKSRWKDELSQAIQVGQDVKMCQILPKDQWGTLKSAQVDTGPTSGLAIRVQLQNQFREQMNKFAMAQNKDPVGTTLQNFPALQSMHSQAMSGEPQAVQSYLTALTAKQEYLKIDNPKITSPQDAQFLGDIINKAPSSAAAADSIMTLKQSYGKYFPQMLSELSEERKKNGGGIDGRLGVAAFMDNKQSIQSIVENVNNAQGIHDLFKQKFNDLDAKKLNQAVQTQIKPVTDSLNAGSPLGGNSDLSQSLSDQISLESKKMLNNNPDMKINDAAVAAKKKIIDSNFNTISGGKSVILAPTSGPNVADPSLVQKFMTYYSAPDGLSKLNVKIPASQLAAHGDDKAGAKEAFLDNLSATGRWVTNEDHSGLILTQKIGDGVSAVKDNNGQVIEKKFSDMSKDADPLMLKVGEKKIHGHGF